MISEHYLHELRAGLDNVALGIVQLVPNPGDWHRWVQYILEALEAHGQEQHVEELKPGFEQMLEQLLAEINIRLKEGGW